MQESEGSREGGKELHIHRADLQWRAPGLLPLEDVATFYNGKKQSKREDRLRSGNVHTI